MRISELGEVKGLACRCVRDGEFDAIALLGRRKDENQRHISFVGDMKYLPQVKSGGIECVICPPDLAEEVAASFDGGIATADDPKTALFTIHDYLSGTREKRPTVIADSAVIAGSASISPVNVEIGEGVIIEDNVVIHPNTVIGDHSVIMANAVIGAPAFYYYGSGDSRKMVTSSGGVKIGRNVHIHCNTSICRGVIGGNTEINDNCSIAENVTLSHDTLIGGGTVISAGATLGGWVRLGEENFVGLGASFAPNIKTGRGVKISMGAVVTKDAADNTQVSGNFAIPHDKFIKDLKNRVKD